MKNLAREVFGALLILFIGVSFVYFLVSYAMPEVDKQNCQKLVEQSEAGYDGFYITADQAKICEMVGITINAPIK